MLVVYMCGACQSAISDRSEDRERETWVSSESARPWCELNHYDSLHCKPFKGFALGRQREKMRKSMEGAGVLDDQFDLIMQDDEIDAIIDEAIAEATENS